MNAQGAGSEHGMTTEEQVAAAANAGQLLAVRWGHQPWSDSWADCVARELLNAASIEPTLSADTVICLDCMKIATPFCPAYHGHGCATLGDLADAYSNPYPGQSA